MDITSDNQKAQPQLTDLDSLEAIQKIDRSNVLGSIQALANQIEDTWEQISKLKLTINSEKIKQVVVTGMGGSTLGPDIVRTLFKQQLSVPFEIVNDYKLPAYVGPETLVIASSYSGTTEETVAALESAQKKQAQILIITTGGILANQAKQHNYDHYIIKPNHNPSNQPRMALGYSTLAVMALMRQLNLLSISEEEINSVIASVRLMNQQFDVEIPQQNNQAKQLAFQIIGRIPVFVAAEHLEGAVHVWQNQFNENSKTYAEYRVIPELNHHLMEGLSFPMTNDHTFYFVLFQSELYHPRNQKRVRITQQVIEQAGIESEMIKLTSQSPLEQVFEMLVLGSYTNFYLAILQGVDPTPIETVDFFKEQLQQES